MGHVFSSLVALAALGPVLAPDARGVSRIELSGNITAIRDIEVPARQPGVLEKLVVREGQMVKKGDVLGAIDDSDAQLRLEAARREYEAAAEQAKDDVKVQEARATEAVARAEHEDSLQTNKRSPGAVPETQLRREELTATRAGLQAKVAEMEFAVARITAQAQLSKVRIIEHEIATRQVRAPFDGLVAGFLRQEGEWVQAGDPVVHLVQMDRLRVKAHIDPSLVSPQELIGRPVQLRIRLPGGRVHEVRAAVSFVSQIIDASNDYQLYVDFDNEPVVERNGEVYWLVRPGMKADMTVYLTDAQ
jgi:multidrug efflux pump subunit AcrA (membrane-fusion protein)